jgi:hypothetical protein
MSGGFSVDPSLLTKWGDDFDRFSELGQGLLTTLGLVANGVAGSVGENPEDKIILDGFTLQYSGLTDATGSYQDATKTSSGGIWTAAEDYQVTERRAYESVRIPPPSTK